VSWKLDINMWPNAFGMPGWFHRNHNKNLDLKNSYESQIIERINDAIKFSKDRWLTKEKAVLQELLDIRKSIAEWDLPLSKGQKPEFQEFTKWSAILHK